MIRNAGGILYELTLKKMKNINIRILSDGTVAVSAPYGTDKEHIDKLVESKKDFINKAEKKLESNVVVPSLVGLNTEDIYKKIFDIYVRIYLRFKDYGFKRPDMDIKIMRSQWGNCRPMQMLIRFNMYLYHLPERCIEIVCAHELSHMVEANHSKRFYAVLESVMPDWKDRDNELKEWIIPREKIRRR